MPWRTLLMVDGGIVGFGKDDSHEILDAGKSGVEVSSSAGGRDGFLFRHVLADARQASA